MAKAKKTTTTSASTEPSDIFIYRLESGAYAAHPSPFVIHPGVEKIRFRNLTGAAVRVQFKAPVVQKQGFNVGAGKKKVVSCASCRPGIYEYKIQFATPPSAPGIQQLPRTYAQGHSSPKIIVDT
jgi:hypothetical protein